MVFFRSWIKFSVLCVSFVSLFWFMTCTTKLLQNLIWLSDFWPSILCDIIKLFKIFSWLLSFLTTSNRFFHYLDLLLVILSNTPFFKMLTLWFSVFRLVQVPIPCKVFPSLILIFPTDVLFMTNNADLKLTFLLFPLSFCTLSWSTTCRTYGAIS